MQSVHSGFLAQLHHPLVPFHQPMVGQLNISMPRGSLPVPGAATSRAVYIPL